MNEQNEMKVLAIELKKGIRRKTKKFLNNRTIRLEFSEEADIAKIPRKVIDSYDAVCLTSEFSSNLTCVFQNIPRDEKKQKRKVRK